MIRSLPVTGGVTWNRRREIPTAVPKKLLSYTMYLRGQCCFTSFRLHGFHTSHLFFFWREEGGMGTLDWWRQFWMWLPVAHQPGDSACAREATAFSRIDAPWHWDGRRFGEDWRNLDHVPVMLSRLGSAGLNIECWTESYRSLAKWSSFFLELPRLDSRNVINPLHEAKLCRHLSSSRLHRSGGNPGLQGSNEFPPDLAMRVPALCCHQHKSYRRSADPSRWTGGSGGHAIIARWSTWEDQRCLWNDSCACASCASCTSCTTDRLGTERKDPPLETRKVIRVLQWLRWRWAVANVDVRMLQHRLYGLSFSFCTVCGL